VKLRLTGIVLTQASFEVVRILDIMESDGTAPDRHVFEFPLFVFETFWVKNANAHHDP